LQKFRVKTSDERCKSDKWMRIPHDMNATINCFQFLFDHTPNVVPGDLQQRPPMFGGVDHSHAFFTCQPIAPAGSVRKNSGSNAESPAIFVVERTSGLADPGRALLGVGGLRVLAYRDRPSRLAAFVLAYPAPPCSSRMTRRGKFRHRN